MPILTYFKNYRKEVVLGPLFKLLEACFELIVPLVIARIVDHIIPSSNQGDLVAMVLWLIGLALIGVCVALTAQYYSAKAAVGYTKELTRDLYRKVLSLPKTKQDEISSASLLTRLTSDTLQIQTGINSFLRLFLRAPIVVFGALIMALSINARLSLLFLGMIAVLLAVVVLISKTSSYFYHLMRKSLDSLVDLVRETSLGMRVIRAFGQQKREIAVYTFENTAYKEEQIKAGVWATLLTPATYIVVNATLLLLIWQGRLAILGSELEQGMLVALINYLLQILVELVKMVTVVATMNQTFISFSRVNEVFEQASEDVDKPLPQQKNADKSTVIEVDQASFSYNKGRDVVLKNINFKVSKGEFFGVIGGTGSGKSSLIDLLLAFYSCDTGNVWVFKDGHSPDNLASWRAQFAHVPQKAQLFSGTVRSNLTLGLKEVADEKIWWALAIAQACDFLKEKEGLDTRVEAFGRNFSGGQRQRLTIARAILQEKPILILDDATSALDYLTEKKLLQALHKELPNQTLIMISQRTNSLINARQILVLDKGEQLGLASHKELLETCSVYREIAQSQTEKGGRYEK